MNENKTSCAPADNQQTLWDRIDWTKAELAVRKLQARIVKAQKEGRHNKVKTLQWMLTHSFYAKALAVKRVTSNKGKNTSGVDKQLWDSPKRKYKAIGELSVVATIHSRSVGFTSRKRTVNSDRWEYRP